MSSIDYEDQRKKEEEEADWEEYENEVLEKPEDED